MLIFNNREGKKTLPDQLRYITLAGKMSFKCVNNFNQYLYADVPCQKLTEGLEGLYYALASYFLIDNLLTPFYSSTKSGDKRSMVFEEIWPRVMIVVDRKSTRLNSSHSGESRMPSSA